MIDEQLLCLWAQQCATLDSAKIVPAELVYILAQRVGQRRSFLP